MQTYSNALQNCLIAIGQGTDLQACLSRYPEYAPQLRERLEPIIRMRNDSMRLRLAEDDPPIIEMSLDAALSDSIQKVKQGRSPQECYALYPQYQAALSVWLETVYDLLKNGDAASREDKGCQEMAFPPIPFQDALENCLRLLEAGENPENVLARHPYYTDRLKPWVTYMNELRPYYDFSLHPWEIPATKKSAKKYFSFKWPRHTAPMLLFALLITTSCLFAFTGLAQASSTSLPGDMLYNVKRTVETVQIMFATDGTKTTLAQRYNLERLTEVQALLQARRTADVVFSGPLKMDPVSGQVWVDEIPAIFADPSQLKNTHNGLFVSIHGQTTSDGLVLIHWLEISSQP